MENSPTVTYLYSTRSGRALLQMIMKLHLDHLAALYLKSSLSRPVISPYIKKHRIPMEEFRKKTYCSFQDFFLREKKEYTFDAEPEHLISPCDGWLSVFPIKENAAFKIKGSCYQISDLMKDRKLASQFSGGQCLIFRLCASDYHHYCFVDDGVLLRTQYLEGELHSVQPIACETYPVYTHNRRIWALMQTKHFGSIVQTEIGAMIVGEIVNHKQIGPFLKGEKYGHFDLSGSTIVLLLSKDAVVLRPEIREALLREPEVRVHLGMWIGSQQTGEDT